MRTSTAATFGAGLIAATLALTFGAGPASATDDVHVSKSFGPRTPDAPAASAPKAKYDIGFKFRDSARGELAAALTPDLATFVLARDQVLYAKGDNNVLSGTVVIKNEPAGFYNLTTMFFNGKEFTGYNPQLFSGYASKKPWGGVVIPAVKGPGLYSFGPSAIFDSETTYTEDLTTSNTIRVRNATQARTTYDKSGKRHKIGAAISVFKPSVGIFGSGITSARLQYKSGSTWRAYKTIKLNRYGKGSVSFSTSKKRRYRVLVPTTRSVQGGIDTSKGVYF